MLEDIRRVDYVLHEFSAWYIRTIFFNFSGSNNWIFNFLFHELLI